MTELLTGRRILVTGVLTDRSLAWSAARLLESHGAELLLTGHKRALRLTRRAADELPGQPDVLELDVLEDGDYGSLHDEVQRRWGRVDGIVHAIAGAPAEVWETDFLSVPRTGIDSALTVSALSLASLVGAMLPLLERSPSPTVACITTTPERHSVDYGWMSVVKATLNALTRQLAVELGPRGVRLNAVACGPVATVAGTGIPGFANSAAAYAERAPLGWDAKNVAAAAGALCFLMSDLSRCMTGAVLDVDGGMHAAL